MANGVLNSMPRAQKSMVEKSVLKLNNDLDTNPLERITNIKAVKGRTNLFVYRVNPGVRAIIERNKEGLNLVDIIEINDPSNKGYSRHVTNPKVLAKGVIARARKRR